MTDHTITIAGLETRIGVLSEALYIANRGRADLSTDASKLDARLGAMESERDALAAQLAEVRADLQAAQTDLHAARRSDEDEIDVLRADLASERAHLAACRTRIAGLERAADERSKEVALLTERMASIETAKSFQREAWQRLLVAIDPDAITTDDALRVLAERATAQVTADREVARLTARVAELEARPVLDGPRLAVALSNAHDDACARWAGEPNAPVMTMIAGNDVLRHLGPVTLPAQDTAAQIVRVYIAEHAKIAEQVRAGDFSWHPEMCKGLWHTEVGAAIQQVAMSRALASLGAPPSSPPAARPVFASLDELARTFWCATGRGYKPEQWETLAPSTQAEWIKGTAAVLARLEVSLVAPVDPEVLLNKYYGSGPSRDGSDRELIADMRAALTAAGIPVTPEVGK